jgi:hypothetical protein
MIQRPTHTDGMSFPGSCCCVNARNSDGRTALSGCLVGPERLAYSKIKR